MTTHLDLGEDDLCQEDVGSDDTASCEFTVTHPTFTGGLNYISAVDGRDNKASEYAEFTLEESIQASPAGGSPGEIMLIQVVDFPGNPGGYQGAAWWAELLRFLCESLW